MLYIDKIAYWPNPSSMYKNGNTFLTFRKEVGSIDEAECTVLTYHEIGEFSSKDTLIEYLNQFKQKTVIIDATFENLRPDTYQWIKDSKIDYKIYTNGIWGSTDEDIQDSRVNIQPYFLTNLDLYKPIQKSSKNLQQKAFIYMVGKCRTHRLKLLKRLYEENLVKEGHVSYFLSKELNFNPEITEENPKRLLEFFKDRPQHLSLDSSAFTFTESHTKEFTRDYFDVSEFAIITETFTEYNGVHFFTEKVGKCILLNKKFILLGPVRSISKLKSYCKRYLNLDISHLTDWADLTYDIEEDLDTRIELIVDQIKINVKKFKEELPPK